MFARIAMFALALLALWMIWRVVRQWIDANAARGDADDEQREARRLSHQRSDGSDASLGAGASGEVARSGVRRDDDSRDPEAASDPGASGGEDRGPGP